MVRIGLVVRVLMLATCLVPFTSPRQASAVVPTSVPAPALPTPIGGQEEEVERGEEAAAKEAARTTHPVPHRLSAPVRPSASSSAHHRRTPSPVPTPVPLDPFRNGLGSPYRC
jgi:hypothetical protein